MTEDAEKLTGKPSPVSHAATVHGKGGLTGKVSGRSTAPSAEARREVLQVFEYVIEVHAASSA